jgi:hypothetical protein
MAILRFLRGFLKLFNPHQNNSIEGFLCEKSIVPLPKLENTSMAMFWQMPFGAFGLVSGISQLDFLHAQSESEASYRVFWPAKSYIQGTIRFVSVTRSQISGIVTRIFESWPSPLFPQIVCSIGTSCWFRCSSAAPYYLARPLRLVESQNHRFLE